MDLKAIYKDLIIKCRDNISAAEYGLIDLKVKERLLRRLLLTGEAKDEEIAYIQKSIRTTEGTLKRLKKELELLEEIKNENALTEDSQKEG